MGDFASAMHRRLLVPVKLLVTMSVTTTLCTGLWQGLVTDILYNCTDPGWLDYLFPGNWVHGLIATVPLVVTGRPMSDPDTLRTGWSVRALWCLWLTLFATSLVFSFWVAQKPWAPSGQTEPKQ